MNELLQENWPIFLIAFLIGIAVAWFIFVATRRTRVETSKGDTLDEGAEKAARNQALIDAPAAAIKPDMPMPPPAPEGLAGTGAALATAVEAEQVQHSEAATSPEPAPAEPAKVEPAKIEPTPDGDDLTRIKGVGPKLAAILRTLDISSFAQIAAWSEADIDRIDAQLGRFEGRIRRDNWVEQAKLLAAGDMAGYEGKFGKL